MGHSKDSTVREVHRNIGLPNKKSLTNNGKTKKQFPNERKGGSLQKNAN